MAFPSDAQGLLVAYICVDHGVNVFMKGKAELALNLLIKFGIFEAVNN